MGGVLYVLGDIFYMNRKEVPIKCGYLLMVMVLAKHCQITSDKREQPIETLCPNRESGRTENNLLHLPIGLIVIKFVLT